MTNEHSRLVVWIDHKVAHLYAFTATGAREIAVIRAPDQGAGHIITGLGAPAADTWRCRTNFSTRSPVDWSTCSNF